MGSDERMSALTAQRAESGTRLCSDRSSIYQPDQAASGRTDDLRGQHIGLVRSRQDLAQSFGLASARDEKRNVRSRVEDWRRERDAPGAYFVHVICRYPARWFIERGAARKERSRVPIVTHPQQDKVETG